MEAKQKGTIAMNGRRGKSLIQRPTTAVMRSNKSNQRDFNNNSAQILQKADLSAYSEALKLVEKERNRGGLKK